MKPVVSSIVALVIATAPFTALASPENDTPAAATTSRAAKRAHAKKVDRADEVEESETAPARRVRHTHKDSRKSALKHVLHHATGVELGGQGHREPLIPKGVRVLPASLVTKSAEGGLARVSHQTRVESKPVNAPKLPTPEASKAAKAATEKGARKASEKRTSGDSDADGQPARERDEEMADLEAGSARVRATPAPDDEAKGDKAEASRGEAKSGRKGKHVVAEAEKCLKEPIAVIRGPEIDTFELTTCEGGIAPLAIEHLSVSVRPGSAARPVMPFVELAKKAGSEIAKGIHRVDERLALRLQAVADHFGKAGAPVKLSVVSGYRSMSIGSMHAMGRAIDFRVEGASNEDVVAFCKTLTDTGCGFYPKNSFVHLDVRDADAGHVSWIDASEPGESPHYVTAWPPRASRASADKLQPVSAKHRAKKTERDAEESSARPEEHAAPETR